jgi:hypothetical protein
VSTNIGYSSAIITTAKSIKHGYRLPAEVIEHEDKSRSRTGHGPANVATVRHFGFDILKAVDDKRSLKIRRNKAARNPDYMALIIGQVHQPRFSAVGCLSCLVDKRANVCCRPPLQSALWEFAGETTL